MTGKTLMAITLSLLAAPTGALAQKIELVPFLGWQFGGTFNNINVPSGAGVNKLDIANSPDYGLVADIALMPQLQIELLYSRQQSRLKTDDQVTGGEITILDNLAVNYFHAGFVFQQPGNGFRKPQGFVAITGGVTRFTADAVQSATRASFGGAIGAKSFFSEHFGARLQSRLMITYFPDTSELFCSPSGLCYQIPTDTFLPQIDISAGLIVAF